MTREVSNSENILDSRDVISRIEELEALESAASDAQEEFNALDDDSSDEAREAAAEALSDAQDDFDDDAQEELKVLREFAEQAEGYASDWRHGATLIRDSYFTEYAQQLAEDIGAIDSNASWPNTCIDWEQAASELQQDYSAVEFDGVTYWMR